MPRHYIPAAPRRPVTCACGATFQPATTGRLPKVCPACRARRAAAALVRIVAAQVDMAALPVVDAKATGDLLIAIGQRGTKRYRAERKRRGGVG